MCCVQFRGQSGNLAEFFGRGPRDTVGWICLWGRDEGDQSFQAERWVGFWRRLSSSKGPSSAHLSRSCSCSSGSSDRSARLLCARTWPPALCPVAPRARFNKPWHLQWREQCYFKTIWSCVKLLEKITVSWQMNFVSLLVSSWHHFAALGLRSPAPKRSLLCSC